MQYEQIVSFLNTHAYHVASALSVLEKDIISGRDARQVPVYLTKYRVKSADSIFLKLNRKSLGDPMELPDLGGLRVLCLFDQDIDPVFGFLIKYILRRHKIKKINVFNFDDNSLTSFQQHPAWSSFNQPKPDITLERRHSGYRSIHFLLAYVHGVEYPLEVQLRTLLQDVWGELEHFLLYKTPRDNPQLRNSFQRLQTDLSNMGTMLSQLKDTSIKDRIYDEYLMRDNGPDHFLWYEDIALPAPIKEDPDISLKFKEYTEAAISRETAIDKGEAAKHMRALYDSLRASTDGRGVPLERINDKDLDYLLRVEDAYCSFAEGKLDNALRQYHHLINNQATMYGSRYVPYFRCAEIHFGKGDIVAALRNLDKASEILNLSDLKTIPHISLVNAYWIKLKAAYLYWLLGRDYTHVALAEILAAERIFNEAQKHREVAVRFDRSDWMGLANSLCWYRLAKYLAYMDERDVANIDGRGKRSKPEWEEDTLHLANELYSAAERAFNELSGYLDDQEVTVNALDTAAWFCYKTYQLRGKNEEWLNKALHFGNRMLGKKDRTTFKASVAFGRHERLREITTTASERGIW